MTITPQHATAALTHLKIELPTTANDRVTTLLPHVQASIIKATFFSYLELLVVINVKGASNCFFAFFVWLFRPSLWRFKKNCQALARSIAGVVNVQTRVNNAHSGVQPGGEGEPTSKLEKLRKAEADAAELLRTAEKYGTPEEIQSNQILYLRATRELQDAVIASSLQKDQQKAWNRLRQILNQVLMSDKPSDALKASMAEIREKIRESGRVKDGAEITVENELKAAFTLPEFEQIHGLNARIIQTHLKECLHAIINGEGIPEEEPSLHGEKFNLRQTPTYIAWINMLNRLKFLFKEAAPEAPA